MSKLIVGVSPTIVKIEPNEILRGVLSPGMKLDLTGSAENLFQQSVTDVPVISFEELYAGKICAALDRQHPRDLFDIKMLYENEGISDEVRKTFVVYLSSSPRPMNELLDPNLLDMSLVYQSDFLGMTDILVGYKELEAVREKLINDLQENLTNNEREFLVSVKLGEPNWSLLPFENLHLLPALRWKVLNVQRMEKKKHQMMLNKLKEALSM